MTLEGSCDWITERCWDSWAHKRVGLGLNCGHAGVWKRGIYVSCLVTGRWCRSAGSCSGCTALKGGIIYILHTAERPFWSEGRFLSVYVFAQMCFGAVFNIIFHIFFIAVGAFGRLYSQEDTENPSELSLLHLNHSDCFFGGVGGVICWLLLWPFSNQNLIIGCLNCFILVLSSLCFKGLKRTPS